MNGALTLQNKDKLYIRAQSTIQERERKKDKHTNRKIDKQTDRKFDRQGNVLISSIYHELQFINKKKRRFFVL